MEELRMGLRRATGDDVAAMGRQQRSDRHASRGSCAIPRGGDPRVPSLAPGNQKALPDTALRLARFFGGDAQSWLNLQVTYDLKVASRNSAKAIAKEVPTVAELATSDGRFALGA